MTNIRDTDSLSLWYVATMSGGTVPTFFSDKKDGKASAGRGRPPPGFR
jgi:hypothetical protein